MFKTISIDHLANVVGGCGPQAQPPQPKRGAGGPQAEGGGPEDQAAAAQPAQRPLAGIAQQLPEIISMIVGQVRQARQGAKRGAPTAQA